jgi:ubiquinone/menaquinone biosynthesis C-methylase UbiE
MNIEQEKERYQFMWASGRYRRNSPAMRHVNHFLFTSRRAPGDTLIDLGCGMGHAGKRLSKYLHVFLFDLVHQAVEVEGLPFIEGNIWDLSALPVFDWVYCCDVLEHIPPERVDETLTGMARITRKGGIATVSHLPSPMSDFGITERNEELHLTVESSDWWTEKIGKLWHIKNIETNWRDSQFTLGPPIGRELEENIPSVAVAAGFTD